MINFRLSSGLRFPLEFFQRHLIFRSYVNNPSFSLNSIFPGRRLFRPNKTLSQMSKNASKILNSLIRKTYKFGSSRIVINRDGQWDWDPMGFWVPGHKSLGRLGLRQIPLGQSREFELWDSSSRDKNHWDWQSRPMPIIIYKDVCKKISIPNFSYSKVKLSFST